MEKDTLTKEQIEQLEEEVAYERNREYYESTMDRNNDMQSCDWCLTLYPAKELISIEVDEEIDLICEDCKADFDEKKGEKE
jgi:hypothetical protein